MPDVSRTRPWFVVTMLLAAATVTAALSSMKVKGWSLVAVTLCLLAVTALCTFRALRELRSAEDDHS